MKQSGNNKQIQRLQELLESTSDWIWEVNNDFQFTYCSPQAYDITGYRPEELLGHAIFDFMPAHCGDKIIQAKKQSSENNPGAALEQCQLTHKDGNTVTIETKFKPLMHTDGTQTGIRCVSHNISQNVQHATQLRNERNFNNAVLQTAQGLIVVLDKDGRIKKFNQACEQATGYRFAEVYDQYIWDYFIVPEEIQAVRDVFNDLKNSQLPNEFTNYWLTKNAKKILVHWRNSLLTNDQGETEYLVSVGTDVSNEKSASDSLVKNNKLLARIFENTHTLIAYLDTQFNFVRVNSAYAHNLNKTADELTGRNHFDIVPTNEFIPIFEQVRDSGEAHFSYATAFRNSNTPDQGILYWDWSLQAVRNDDDQIIGLLLVLADVSKRIEAQKALLRNEETLKQAQSIAHFGSWDWNILTGELEWTDEIYRIFGQLPQAFPATYDAFINTIHEADRDAIINAVNEAVANPKINYDIEHRVVRPGGEIRFVHEQGHVYRDNNGTPIRMIGTVHDITERRLIMESLNQFKTTLDLTNECVFMFNTTDLKFFYANKGAMDQIGYNEREIMQLTPVDIKPNISMQQFRALIEPLISRRETSLTFKTIHQHKNGHPIPVEISLNYICPDGEPERFVAIVQDITERNAAEQKILDLNRELENRVQQRTIELEKSLALLRKENEVRKSAERSLVQARDDAEQANRLKSEFLGRMSHELRTPMNAILGFGQLLEEEVRGKHPKEYINEVMRASNHLMAMIDEVLDLAKIESGKLELKLENIAVVDAVQEAILMTAPFCDTHKIKINNLVSQEDIYILADRVRLIEIITNLITNAVKYNRTNGEVTITVNTITNDSIHIDVSDTGIGIPADKMPYIFEPFNRIGQEYSNISGAGIGLSIVKQLVSLMSGQIGVNSVEGEGSNFWVELPRTLSNIPTINYEDTTVHSHSGSIKKSVLYIEDNPANLRLVERIAEQNPQIIFLSAPNAELGIELARKKKPDLILLDLNLPGMDGYEALSRLRNYPETSTTPAVALSAAATPRDIERGLLAGFKRYLTKPIQITELREMLIKELGLQTSVDGNEEQKGLG